MQTPCFHSFLGTAETAQRCSPFGWWRRLGLPDFLCDEGTDSGVDKMNSGHSSTAMASRCGLASPKSVAAGATVF